ncbi:MAG TPA: hypothetical protein VFZ42_08880 [Chitinophagaceae bacterium]
MYYRLLTLVALVLLHCPVFSQRVFINGKEGDRPLSWNDFKGSPDDASPFGAYTFTNFRTKGENFTFKGDSVKFDKPVEYWVELGTNSWVKKDKRTDTLLQHEEGHFIIGKLLVLELNARMRTTVFLKSNYKQLLISIPKEVAAKYQALEKMYDKETDHSKNRSQQWKWNQFLQSELVRLKTGSNADGSL